MPACEKLLGAAERLHAYLLRRHYDRGCLRGPDAGVRFNLRAWRFLKSACDFVPWHDDYVFIQTQGYWILSNWMLYEVKGDSRFRDIALESTEATLRLQRADGTWAYPLPERRHLIATVEGNWGAIGLLASYAREPEPRFLEGAVRWYDFLIDRSGFQAYEAGKAINYFDRPRGKVPNNSVEAAWVFARLWRATGDERYLEHVSGMMDFVRQVQLPSGELPYVVESPYERRREHYLCYQYNAFQFLKLAWCQRLSPLDSVAAILPGLARFLATGVTPSGACAEDCFSQRPEVDYYTAALAAALGEAVRLGLIADGKISERPYAQVAAHQKADGSFIYSEGDYGILHDHRSYPRPMAMTLYHLLYGAGTSDGFPLDL
ncbi:MAG: hypothetical protein P8Z30_10920 [Acidobacteriota bacterium]